MSNKLTFLKMNIQLFAEGGASASGGADGGTSSGGENGVTGGASLPQSKRNANPLADVVYGKQDDDGVVQNATATDPEPTVDRDAEFEKMIKGEYKDLYDKRVQDTITKRLKSTKETVDKYNSLAPTLEALSRKYGVDATDIEALNRAIEEDDSYYEEEALEKGVTVEQLKEIKKIERENAQLRAEREQAEKQAEIDRDIANWIEESKEAQKSFPNLDLGTELENPQFVGLLKMGVSMENAYFAIHHKELVPQAMQYTAKEVESKLAKKIAGNGMMPRTNGTNGVAPSVVKSDVSQLSKEDRAEIARRVARGERIVF